MDGETSPAVPRDDARTIASIATVAYCPFAAFVHEGLGHGGMCVLSGGHIQLLTSVNEYCSISGRWVDAGGPFANLAAGLIFLALAMGARGPSSLRLFFILGTAFNLYWFAGYLVYSGVLGVGDWSFVIAGLEPAGFYRALLFAIGLGLYLLTSHTLVRFFLATGFDAARTRRIAWIAYVTAAIVACTVALRDPIGNAVLDHALPAAAAGFISLLFVPRLVRAGPANAGAVPFSLLCLAAVLVALIFFAAVLGPGFRNPL